MAKTLLQAEITKMEVVSPKDASESPKLRLVLVGAAHDDVLAELAGMMKNPWVMVWIEGLQGQLMQTDTTPAGPTSRAITINTETGEIFEGEPAEAEVGIS